jgi:signal transduction histidine kinase
MRQVLLNLLRNAIEASPAGGTIRVATRREGDDLILEIVNPAEAIDDQALGRAFEPFCSTKARGTGLGLGLVKRVVEEHGGRIRLDADGQEVQVEIRLPLRGP